MAISFILFQVTNTLQRGASMKKIGHRYECTTCTKSFTRRFTLRRHQLTHTRAQPITCPTCGKHFHHLDVMKQHQDLQHRTSNTGVQKPRSHPQSHHQVPTGNLQPRSQPGTSPPPPKTGRVRGKTVPCSKCGKTFKSFDRLRKHKQSVHQRAPSTTPVNWDQPSTSHDQRSSSPELIHSSVHPRRDKSPSSAKLNHSTVDSRRCQKCGKVFSRPYSMRRHFKLKHGSDGEMNQSIQSVQPVSEPERPQSDDDVLKEDPVEYPNSENSLSRVERDNWRSIRTHHLTGHILDTYNIRLVGREVDVPRILLSIFDIFNCRVKINISFGFVLRHTDNGDLRYFHASSNNAGFFPVPVTIGSQTDFEFFLEKLHDLDILEVLGLKRPDSKWTVAAVTNLSTRCPRCSLVLQSNYHNTSEITKVSSPLSRIVTPAGDIMITCAFFDAWPCIVVRE